MSEIKIKLVYVGVFVCIELCDDMYVYVCEYVYNYVYVMCVILEFTLHSESRCELNES